MSNEEKPKPNALVPIEGFDDDPGSNPLRGPGVKFKDGAYYTFGDKLDVKGRTFAVVERKRGWQKLQKDCAPEYLMRQPGEPMPPQPQVPKEDWPLNLNSEKEHPWKSTHYLVLLDTATGEVSTFWSNTTGGRIAIDALKDQIVFMWKHRPNAIPIIALESRPMPTQYGGTTPRPHFQIKGWKMHGGAETQLPADEQKLIDVQAPSISEQMDDAIPDFGETENPAPAAETTKKKKKK